MAQSIITMGVDGFNPIVGMQPQFPPNATMQKSVPLLYSSNTFVPGRSVSAGDEVTVLDICGETQLVLLQYPTSQGYVQGYVYNEPGLIKYKNGYNWANGSTSEAVYDLDKTTQIGSLDSGETAVELFKVDGMTAVAYDTLKGPLTKSGLVCYEGTGSSSGSSGGNSFNGITPGDVVPGGFSYEQNAEVVGDELYLRDQVGNLIKGCSVSVGDKITVLDVSCTKQLALVQYPAGNVVKQGYVTNATKLIRYFKPYEWHNGSTEEEVLDENGHHLGSLSAYESATPLYITKEGLTHVVYDTPKGQHTKSGFVRYAGSPGFSDSSIEIPDPSHPGVEKFTYGQSGKSRPLNVYKIGNGDKVLFAGFAIHGWEDNEPNDGLILVKIAHELISKFSGYNSQNNGLHGWTVYIAPCMNPDGVIVNGTKNGPGRCTVTTRIDMNRCFPYHFNPQYSPRNFTGQTELLAPESKALRDYILEIKPVNSEMVVLDFHGWMNFTQGNPELGKYFCNQFGFDHHNQYSSGFFSCWANELKNTKGVLIEYPGYTHSYQDAVDNNFAGKTFNAILDILKDYGSSNTSNEHWSQENGKWHYYINGTKATGWKSIGGKWYYLNDDGVMLTGWVKLQDVWYYLESNGAMVTGWQSIGGKWYYRVFSL